MGFGEISCIYRASNYMAEHVGLLDLLFLDEMLLYLRREMIQLTVSGLRGVEHIEVSTMVLA